MTKLLDELQRLFFWSDQEGPSTGLVTRAFAGEALVPLPLLSHDLQVRTLVAGVARFADWKAVAALYEGVQEQWAWPAPAVSVSPEAGFQVWFSLAEAIPIGVAERILHGLKKVFLSELPPSSVQLLPSMKHANPAVALVPSFHEASGNWSAFIDPTMAGMFSDQLGLDIAPNFSRQADMLAGLRSINPADVRRVLALLDEEAERRVAGAEHAAVVRLPLPDVRQPAADWRGGGDFTDPKAFLLAVMNDQQAGIQDRIHAATALLPYFEKARPE